MQNRNVDQQMRFAFCILTFAFSLTVRLLFPFMIGKILSHYTVGIHFIAMQYVEGQTLNTQIQDHALPNNDIAVVYVGLRQKDRAMEWLEKAYEQRTDTLTYIKMEPRFDPLRSDPRFQDMLRRLHLA